MPDPRELLRNLPRVDQVIAAPAMQTAAKNVPASLALAAARSAVDAVREEILQGQLAEPPELAHVAERAAAILARMRQPSLRRVVNAAGIVLHTALGRAPLSDAAQASLADATEAYSNVQASLDTGRRIHRETHVENLLQRISGAESALVVNNNAAATVLVLNTLAAGREVILSRGELVEIGGAFRIPDILRLAGCRLVEVGCTNRTHLRDYAQAIGEHTAMILSIHQSNYRIVGFTSQAAVGDLAELAHKHNLPCVHDLGSGALIDFRQLGLPHEPSVPESVAAGADVMLFSGDKLLGGPQCGIIVGKAEYLQAMHKNPFYRIFRVGKMTLAALEATLRLFLDPARLPQTHRVTSFLTRPAEEIQTLAEELAAAITGACGSWLTVETRPDDSQVGGGSLAGYVVPTTIVRIRTDSMASGELARQLRLGAPPVFARVSDDAILLDPRTLMPGDAADIVNVLSQIGRSLSEPKP